MPWARRAGGPSLPSPHCLPPMPRHLGAALPGGTWHGPTPFLDAERGGFLPRQQNTQGAFPPRLLETLPTHRAADHPCPSLPCGRRVVGQGCLLDGHLPNLLPVADPHLVTPYLPMGWAALPCPSWFVPTLQTDSCFSRRRAFQQWTEGWRAGWQRALLQALPTLPRRAHLPAPTLPTLPLPGLASQGTDVPFSPSLVSLPRRWGGLPSAQGPHLCP